MQHKKTFFGGNLRNQGENLKKFKKWPYKAKKPEYSDPNGKYKKQPTTEKNHRFL